MERPQAEQFKNMAFLERGPKEIFNDEYWTVSEALCIYTLLLNKTRDDLEGDEYFRLLYALIMTGIQANEIKPINNVFKKIKPSEKIIPKSKGSFRLKRIACLRP
jgi:hypothetical protein